MNNNKKRRGNNYKILKWKIGFNNWEKEVIVFSGRIGPNQNFHISMINLAKLQHSWAIHRNICKKISLEQQNARNQHIPMKSDSHVGILSHIITQIDKRTHAVHACIATLHSTIPFYVTCINIHWNKCLVESEKKNIHSSIHNFTTTWQVFVFVFIRDEFFFQKKEGTYDDES